MTKNLKKYINFEYFSLVRKLIMKGQYILTTYNNYTTPENKKALITTNFYLDGDALNVIYENNDELLIEEYPEKLEEHKSILNKKIGTLEVFSEHLKWFSTILSAVTSFLFNTGNNWAQLGLFGVFALIGYIFRKYIL